MNTLLDPTFGELNDVFEGRATPYRLWSATQPLQTEVFAEPLRLDFQTTDELGITSSHKAVLEDFLKHQALYKELVLTALLEHFRAAIIPLYRRESFPESLAPEVSNLTEFEALLSLPHVTVRKPVNGVCSIGFGFECTWDVEHGTGALVRNRKVLEAHLDKTYIADVEE